MNLKFATMLAGAALLIAAGPQAHAQDTAAGTPVVNTATVTYTIDDVEQETEPTGDVTFKVDRRVDLEVAEVGSTTTSVSPGATDKMLTFTVTNSSNDTIDVALAASDTAAGTSVTLGTAKVDTKNTLSTGVFTIFVDANNNDTFDAGTDLEQDYIDALAPGDTRTVFVFADMENDAALNPNKIANADIIVVELTATAHSAYVDQTDTTSGASPGLGVILANDEGDADDKDLVQNVFADGADADGTGEFNGEHSAYDAYEVANTEITVTKTYGVVSDPITDESEDEPKAIPGAVLVYCITVKNEGDTDATDVTVSDPVPTLTEYESGTIRIYADELDCSTDPVAASTTGTLQTDADDLDDGDAGPGGTGPITTTTSSLDADAATTTIFQVKIK